MNAYYPNNEKTRENVEYITPPRSTKKVILVDDILLCKNEESSKLSYS